MRGSIPLRPVEPEVTTLSSGLDLDALNALSRLCEAAVALDTPEARSAASAFLNFAAYPPRMVTARFDGSPEDVPA